MESKTRLHGMTRRKVLTDAAKIAGVLTLTRHFPAISLERNTKPHFFVLVRANGGAHPPLGLDPIILSEITRREIDPISLDTGETSVGDPRHFYPAYTENEYVRAGDLILGKAAKPLLPWVQDIAFLNGVMLLPQSPFHDVCRRYGSTGLPGGTAPLIPFQLERETLSGSQFGTFFNGALDNDLKSMLLGTPLSSLGVTLQSRTKRADPAVVRARQRLRNGGGLSAAFRGVIDLEEKGPKAIQLNEEYRKALDVDALAFSSEEDAIRLLAVAFNSGLARFASLDLEDSTGVLDSHNQHREGHVLALESKFSYFAALLKAFKNIRFEGGDREESLFENTTFLFMSDFARSSWRQGPDGTDHNPQNSSVLLAGKNIAGGKKIGASTVISPDALINEDRSRLQALPFNYSLGRSLSFEEMMTNFKGLLFNSSNQVIMANSCRSGEDCIGFLTPMHVMTTVARAFGLDGTRFLPKVQIIPGVVKV